MASSFNCSKLIVDILRNRALYQPKQLAFTFLLDGETESSSITYQELDLKARAIAAHLQSNIPMGERALLLYPSGLEFIAAFLGCLYAGVIAIPAYPPKRNQKMLRLQAIADDAQAMVTLSTKELLTKFGDRFVENSKLSALGHLATDDISLEQAHSWQEPRLNGNTLAFVQYTSGSSGMPKGVMVSHENLIHNEKMIQMAFNHSAETVVVGWLPLFHDMGLIGNVLQALYLGIPSIFMAPEAFLQQPFRWLQAISRFKATSSGGPNFAYDLCVRKITPEQRLKLDLSSWEVAFNGAEPVQAKTLELFADTFAECGFRPEAFYPCYGMAETTLFISGGLRSEAPIVGLYEAAHLEQDLVWAADEQQSNTKKIVGCGQSWLDQKIMIVDPKTFTLCPTNKIGEIWISGPNVARGYWNRNKETLQTFNAYIADSGEGPFLRTGDLGFLLNGELFVTGRLKDIIIIRGRNHYPQDIELTAEESHESLRADCGAAFVVEINSIERLVIVQEVERTYLRNLDMNDVINSIRRSISEQHGLQVFSAVLVKTGSIPKTSSGKIQRHACLSGFLSGSLDVLESVATKNKSLHLSLQVN
jgi:acyl-CoA synthetase (AMP-forming)/AMP-acid ligase II